MLNEAAFRPIVFTGSSIIEQWASLPRSFQGSQVINTAIGGTQTADILSRLNELVIAHAPRMVCMYCGSNDINNGVEAEKIVENVLQMQHILAHQLKELTFVYLSIIKAPQKRERWNVVDAVNRALCERDFGFIDINPVFFDAEGKPRVEFYVEDQLHLTVEAYEELGKYLFPRLGEE